MQRRPKKRAPALIAIGLACSGFAACSCTPQRGEPQMWLEDYDALKQHMNVVYANLEWAVETGRVDPYELDQETQTALRNTSSQAAARTAIEHFVEAFGDPHFRTERRKLVEVEQPSHAHAADPIPLEVSAKDACKRLGFQNSNLDFQLDLASLDGFERLPQRESNPFFAGVLNLANGRRVGFIRIAQFGPDRYKDVAVPLWERQRGELDGPCDEECQWKFSHRVSQFLLDALDERVRDLHAVQVEALAIDITRNGGGTDWAGIAPRILTAQPLRCPPFGSVKHPSEAERLERRITLVDDKLGGSVSDVKLRKLLETARERLLQQLAQATEPCDRAPLFREPNANVDCSQLVRKSGCGLVDYLAPDELDDPELATLLYSPLHWKYTEGVWDGPLFVIVDAHTASASEQFATLLQANQAAIVLGERTYGAGCGYVDGGFPIDLSNVGLRVRLPNCVRYRADGENELAGVEPDVTVWTKDDKGKDRPRKLAIALNKFAIE